MNRICLVDVAPTGATRSILFCGQVAFYIYIHQYTMYNCIALVSTAEFVSDKVYFQNMKTALVIIRNPSGTGKT